MTNMSKMAPYSLYRALLLTKAQWTRVKSSALFRERGATWDVTLVCCIVTRRGPQIPAGIDVHLNRCRLRCRIAADVVLWWERQ